MTTTAKHQTRNDTAPWTAPHGLTVTVHRADGTTTTAPVVALVDRDDVAGTVRVETLTTPAGPGLAIVRRTHRTATGTRTDVHAEPYIPGHSGTGPLRSVGATVTGHEDVTGTADPLPARDQGDTPRGENTRHARQADV